ncbi:hypothetical protein [Streptomyces albogriseolus]|uniref:hypothetical protein n=1 Tax=Streptomyces albogriseolus TaxID=1887 RepID=UPI00379E3D33
MPDQQKPHMRFGKRTTSYTHHVCGPYPMLFTPLSNAESVLIYPIPGDAAPLRDIWSPASAAGSHKALAALLGATRAAVLSTLADFATTTEIARCLNISPPSVSQQPSLS